MCAACALCMCAVCTCTWACTRAFLSTTSTLPPHPPHPTPTQILGDFSLERGIAAAAATAATHADEHDLASYLEQVLSK